MGSESFWQRRLAAGNAPPAQTPGAQPPPNHGGLYGQPTYQQPVQQQPVPVGYDASGQPVYAPPGHAAMYDQQGRFMGWQPTVGGVPVQPPQQQYGAYVPGLGQVPGQPGGPPPDMQLPMMDAIAMRTGTQYKPRAIDIGNCPECQSNMYFAREGRVLNKKTGEFASPAPQCDNCGYAGPGFSTEQSGSIHGALASSGGTVQVVGNPRMARGSGDRSTAAGQSGMPNLFAPKR